MHTGRIWPEVLVLRGAIRTGLGDAAEQSVPAWVMRPTYIGSEDDAPRRNLCIRSRIARPGPTKPAEGG